MYYPIIDKLKEIMADITSVKEKEPLTIIGTMTSINGGTWLGDWNNIVNAFVDNKPVYFKLQVADTTVFTPIISLSNTYASSCNMYINNLLAYGTISNDGTFAITPLN